MKTKPLWKHQIQTKALLSKQSRVLDASDPGTGKTRGALESWAERRAKKGKCALVIAPKSLLRSAWGEDIDEYISIYSYSIAYASNREAAFASEADIYITNTDAVKWLAKQPLKFFKRFDTLIIDELTSFKHRSSQRSKALRSIVRHFKHREGLTGTPNSNSITDIWHQVLLLDDGERLGTNFFKFRESTCYSKQVGPGAAMVRWEDKDGAEDAVAYLLRDMTIRHDFEECMDIPQNFTHTSRFELSPKLRKAYEQMKRDAIVELEKETATAINAASLRTKLLQIASGAVYTSTDGTYEVVDNSRYELITDLIEEHQHSVTFFVWKHQKAELVKSAEKRGLPFAVIDGDTPIKEREAIVKGYQAGMYQTIYLHPQTGAHGLTLTKGTRTIWASPIYQPDFLKQGKHRIYRGGQTKRTETILVEAEDTVEQLVYDRLNVKNARMLNLLDILKGE